MIGAFIEWEAPARYRRQARQPPGWIIEGNGCHIWTGSRNKKGYGMVRSKGRTYRIHRLRYEREIGPIPEGLQLDHFVCNNPTCCNPHHVRPVSARENSLRSNSFSSTNLAKTHCPNGHPYSGENLDLKPYSRYCRACRHTADKLRAVKKRALLPPRES